MTTKHTFAIGDIVRCVRPNRDGELALYRHYTVTGYGDGFNPLSTIRLYELPNSQWFERRFELVRHAAPAVDETGRREDWAERLWADLFVGMDPRSLAFVRGLRPVAPKPAPPLPMPPLPMPPAAAPKPAAPSETLTLRPEDPFERAVIELVQLNRSKRADYALDTDPWSNFRETAELSGMASALDAVLFNIHQKIVRLKALGANGRKPQNESVRDTYRDMAVYSVIGCVLLAEGDAAVSE